MPGTCVSFRPFTNQETNHGARQGTQRTRPVIRNCAGGSRGERAAAGARAWRRRHAGAQGFDRSRARRNLHSGEALGGPALDPVACYEVTRRGDRVMVGAKKARTTPPPPPQSPAKIVIVGAGAAGAAAAEKLRTLGHRGQIVLIGNEPPGPVDRPNLSKDFL